MVGDGRKGWTVSVAERGNELSFLSDLNRGSVRVHFSLQWKDHPSLERYSIYDTKYSGQIYFTFYLNK